MKKKNSKERKIDYLYDGTIDFLKLTKFYLFTKEKKLITQNKNYYNSRIGKRCFILGNGPSVSLYDLSSLKNETVFCVNEFFRYEKYNELDVDFYFLADPAYFSKSDNKEDNYFSEAIKKISNQKTEVWIPFSFRSEAESKGWNKNRLRYYRNNLTWENHSRKLVRFDRCIPCMQAVIQYAILFASYMGFSEIYLLGVEQTDIFSSLKCYLNADVHYDYAFKIDDNVRQWKRNQILDYSLSDLLAGYSRIFDLYDELYFYCLKNDIILFNCSPGSLIKSIPYKDWNELDFKLKE